MKPRRLLQIMNIRITPRFIISKEIHIIAFGNAISESISQGPTKIKGGAAPSFQDWVNSSSQGPCDEGDQPIQMNCYSYDYRGKLPVKRMWSRVMRKPNLFTAALAALNPSPYAGDTSCAIWCMKNSPSFFSTSDFPPFLEEDEEEEAAPDDVDAIFLLNPGITSDSSHMYEST